MSKRESILRSWSRDGSTLFFNSRLAATSAFFHTFCISVHATPDWGKGYILQAMASPGTAEIRCTVLSANVTTRFGYY